MLIYVVAELFQQGIDALPKGAMAAMLLGGGVGIIFATLERIPRWWARYVPSPTAMGIAFVIPAFYSLSIAFGASLAWILSRVVPQWSARFIIVLASGLIAGDSLTGVGIAIYDLISR